MFATLEAKVLGSIALLAILAGAFGTYTLHERAIGKTKELTELKVSSDQLKADTAKLTAELQTKATTAETAYANEHQANLDYQRDHPIQPVRLCISNANSRAILSSISAAHPGNESAGAASKDVHDLPSGNSSGGTSAAGPDISGLLGLLAVKADDVSAQLREFQAR